MTAIPANFGQHHGTPEDREAIERLLTSYTQSVTSNDKPRFESLLLHPDIPFSSTRVLPRPDEANKSVETRNYASFKAVIFDSGEHFEQQFHNIAIEQMGDLAQVSLDYATKDVATGHVGYGWKVLHLLRVRGEWKIASEFYTAYPTSE
nr:hypothetical protein HUO10_001089 [Paraburkholderia busanensis]